MQYKIGGKQCGHLVCLRSHEKSDRIRPGGPVPVWLSARRGKILCDANHHFLGIARILAITLTAVCVCQ